MNKVSDFLLKKRCAIAADSSADKKHRIDATDIEVADGLTLHIQKEVPFNRFFVLNGTSIKITNTFTPPPRFTYNFGNYEINEMEEDDALQICFSKTLSTDTLFQISVGLIASIDPTNQGKVGCPYTITLNITKYQDSTTAFYIGEGDIFDFEPTIFRSLFSITSFRIEYLNPSVYLVFLDKNQHVLFEGELNRTEQEASPDVSEAESAPAPHAERASHVNRPGEHADDAAVPSL